MRILQSLAIVLAGWCSVGHAMDLLITVPHSTFTDANTMYPTVGMGSYTTTFNVTGNGSNEIYVNVLAKTYSFSVANPRGISYEIKNTSDNNIITYGIFNETYLPEYTSITTHSSGNLIAGTYNIKFFMSGSSLADNTFILGTPRFSQAIVTEMTSVPEPSTIIMTIACCAVLVGVKALC
jgi:hypothetical protein